MATLRSRLTHAIAASLLLTALGGCGAVHQVAAAPFKALDTAHNLSKLALPIADAQSAALGLTIDLVRTAAEGAVDHLAATDK